MAPSSGSNPHPEPPGKVHTTDRLRPFKQDLPPKGGYAPINYKRVPAKQLVNAPILFSAFFLSQAIGLYQVRKFKVLLERERIEEASSRQAMEPILLAERDRDFLKELRKDRDWEKQLMSDVKGWEVGTWFGQHRFKTQPDDSFLLRTLKKEDLYIFSRPRHEKSEMMYKEWMVA